MSVHLICGPMFAGKTTILLNMLDNFKNNRTLVLKHTADTRAVRQGDIETHDGRNFPATRVTSLSKIASFSQFDTIVIDEGQFFQDLTEHCQQWACWGKRVIVSCLTNGLFMEPIPHITEVMAIADQITKLTAQCNTCFEAASFSYRKKSLPSDMSVKDPRFYLGGAAEYDPCCRRCFLKRLKYDRDTQGGIFKGKGIQNVTVPMEPFRLTLNTNPLSR